MQKCNYKSIKETWCILFKSSFGMICSHPCAWKRTVWWKASYIGRSLSRCEAFLKCQPLYGRTASRKTLLFLQNSSTCQATFHSCYLWRSWQQHPRLIRVRIWGLDTFSVALSCQKIWSHVTNDHSNCRGTLKLCAYELSKQLKGSFVWSLFGDTEWSTFLRNREVIAVLWKC